MTLHGSLVRTHLSTPATTTTEAVGVMPDIQLLGHTQQAEGRVIHMTDQTTQAVPGQARQVNLLLDPNHLTGFVINHAEGHLVFGIAQIAGHIRVMQQIALIHGEGFFVAYQHPAIGTRLG